MKGTFVPHPRLLFTLALAMFFTQAVYGQDTTKPAAPTQPSSPPSVGWEDGSFKIGKDVYLRFGALLQPSVELQQDLPTASQDTSTTYNRRWAHQLFVRRMRFMFNGKVSSAFTFFFDFEVANAGRLSIGPSKTGFPSSGTTAVANLLDAQLSYIACQEFSVVAGLMFIGITRNSIQSATSLMPVNYGSYTFLSTNGSPNGLDNAVGRDAGIMFRGFLHENRLEYRLSFCDGRSRLDQAGNIQSLYSPLRFTTRVQWDVFDTQTPDIYGGIAGFYYTGTYFGKKKILALGGGLDVQRGYTSFGGDVFLDYPISGADGITASVSFQHLNGGDPENSELTFVRRQGVPVTTPADSLIAISSTSLARLIPKQSIFFAEAGYFIGSLNLQPVVKFESRSVNGTGLQMNVLPVTTNPAKITQLNHIASQSRFGVGANYFPRGHNFNVKALMEFVSTTQADLGGTAATFPEFKKSYALFTLQGQWMFF